jgi:molybdopterin-guanine dinucleotide biosynthesis protein A
VINDPATSAGSRYGETVLIDALVLTGGRSARLGGVSKPALRYQGSSLLERTLVAVSDARAMVVVGTVPSDIHLPAAVAVTREDPPFSGPAAAIGAGLTALDASAPDEPADLIVVVACDMPNVANATRALWGSLPLGHTADGIVALDDSGHHQPLVAIYRASALRAAVDSFRDSGTLEGLSVRSLVAGLHLVAVPVPAGSTDDVDTPGDAARLGIMIDAAPTKGDSR